VGDDIEHILRGVNVAELAKLLGANGPAALIADVVGFGTVASGSGVVPLRSGNLAPIP
jgi:hypothetical protein